MKIHKRVAAMVLSVLAVLLLLPVQSLAAGRIDLTRDAGLTITECFGDLKLSGVTFEIYLISTVDETGELTPLKAYEKFASGLDIRGQDDAAWQSMAGTLEREILLGDLGTVKPADSAVTDSDGVARFPSQGKKLTLGLYLVLGTRTERNRQVYATAPFFVLLPELNLETNEWNYAVTANTKPDQNPLTADFEVIKLWEDDGHKDQRPRSITIQLMRNGKAYGDPVTLPYEGAWKYTWHDLDTNYFWTVTETQVKGYETPKIRQVGNTFIVTNTWSQPAAPTNPTEPAEPGSTTPGGSTDSSRPVLPQTGMLWWPVPVLLAAGLLCVVIGLARRRGVRR